MAKSSMVTKAFQWQKVETLDFLESFVACNLKICIYSVNKNNLSIGGQVYFFP